jgi:acyl-CoA thioesterase I
MRAKASRRSGGSGSSAGSCHPVAVNNDVQEAEGRDLRVCFVGDSYVAGVGDDSGMGWVGRLTRHAHSCGLPITAYNLGIRRDTAQDVADRLPDEVSRRVNPAAETRVVLAYGLNDVFLDAGQPRVGTADSVAATTRSLDWLASVSIPVVIVGPPPIGDAGQDARTEELDRQLAACAGSRRVPYLPVIGHLAKDQAWLDGVRKGDGAHPGASGYQRYFEVVRDPLMRFLSAG